MKTKMTELCYHKIIYFQKTRQKRKWWKTNENKNEKDSRNKNSNGILMYITAAFATTGGGICMSNAANTAYCI